MVRRSKRRIREEIAKSIKEGDVDQLDRLLSTLHDYGENEAAIESILKLSLDDYTNYVDMLQKATSKPNETPFVWMHVLHEMLLRALLVDFNKFMKKMNRFPMRYYSASMKETNSYLKGRIPSFSDPDYLKAKDLFTTYFENYKKMCELFSGLAGIISENCSEMGREWSSTFPNDQCRYACLRPDPDDVLIRNAISHKTIRRLANGKFELVDRIAKVNKVLSSKTLDDRLHLLIMRVKTANTALSLTGITSNSVILVGIHAIRKSSK